MNLCAQIENKIVADEVLAAHEQQHLSHCVVCKDLVAAHQLLQQSSGLLREQAQVLSQRIPSVVVRQFRFSPLWAGLLSLLAGVIFSLSFLWSSQNIVERDWVGAALSAARAAESSVVSQVSWASDLFAEDLVEEELFATSDEDWDSSAELPAGYVWLDSMMVDL